MSSSEEIQAVYEEDICRMSRCVYNKQGLAPFFEGFKGFGIESLHDGLGINHIRCNEYTPKIKKNARKT